MAMRIWRSKARKGGYFFFPSQMASPYYALKAYTFWSSSLLNWMKDFSSLPCKVPPPFYKPEVFNHIRTAHMYTKKYTMIATPSTETLCLRFYWSIQVKWETTNTYYVIILTIFKGMLECVMNPLLSSPIQQISERRFTIGYSISKK